MENKIIEEFETVGIIENYQFADFMCQYIYDLTMLANGNLVKNKYYTCEDDGSDIFNEELLEILNERTPNNKTKCVPLAVTIVANYIHHPDNPEDDRIELKCISLKNGPKINTHRTETLTGIITSFEQNHDDVTVKINVNENTFAVFHTDADRFIGVDLTKQVTITILKSIIDAEQLHPYEITDIKNS